MRHATYDLETRVLNYSLHACYASCYESFSSPPDLVSSRGIDPVRYQPQTEKDIYVIGAGNVSCGLH